jgi:hypothetical protein
MMWYKSTVHAGMHGDQRDMVRDPSIRTGSPRWLGWPSSIPLYIPQFIPIVCRHNQKIRPAGIPRQSTRLQSLLINSLVYRPRSYDHACTHLPRMCGLVPYHNPNSRARRSRRLPTPGAVGLRLQRWWAPGRSRVAPEVGRWRPEGDA